MPELPEVETVRRTVLDRCQHKKIIDVAVDNDSVLANVDVATFRAALQGRAIKTIERRGKYLLMILDNDTMVMLHLRMTGQLVYFEEMPEADKHRHVTITMEQGFLSYRDVRRFGRFSLYQDGAPITDNGWLQLGAEPFDDAFTVDYLTEGLAKRRCPIKNRLLDQTFIAGIGNIYADEILFATAIHPLRRCDSLDEDEVASLHRGCIDVLALAVEKRGTSFSDYVDGSGNAGEFQQFLQVFQRGGEPCPRCGNRLEKCKCGGRGTTFCPHCQKE